MSLLTRMTPQNLAEEKQKFFENPKYNPQFIYEETFTPEILEQHGLPQTQYVTIAQEILDRTYYHRNEHDLFMMEGRSLSQDEVTRKIHTFLKMHKLEQRYEIVWSSSFVSRATIDSSTLKLRLPVDFRKEGLLGMLYHEIGTHALRRINYEQQPWYKKKKKYGFSSYLRTEEGLASLHALLPHTSKSAFISAIRYLAVTQAQKVGFAELWKYLGKYIQDPERRWIVTFRQKRGLTDTSLPGGFTKDLVYFEGIVDVWNWLKKNSFDPTYLYYGKLAMSDVDNARQLNPHFKPALPSFFTIDPAAYASNMSTIGEANGF